MSWNKTLLKRANLYLILDAQVLSYQELLRILKPAIRSGVDIVQLRDKFGSARKILEFCTQIKKVLSKKSLLILNDRIDLAILAKVDGVHLGQEDISYNSARSLMGPKRLIGVSCQNLTHAKRAQEEGADYIGFGSIFKTLTKPERHPMSFEVLKKVIKKIEIPVFPIGGINQRNITSLTGLGVMRVAVCRDILLANNTEKAVKNLKKILG